MADYQHCGTEGYGNYFGSCNWDSVNWAALSPHLSTRAKFLQCAVELGLSTSVEQVTGMVRVSFPDLKQQEGEK